MELCFVKLSGPDGTVYAVNVQEIAYTYFDHQKKLSCLHLTSGRDLWVTEISGDIFERLGVEYD
jgi:hypothetical protein